MKNGTVKIRRVIPERSAWSKQRNADYADGAENADKTGLSAASAVSA
jgi:hypothetical protein